MAHREQRAAVLFGKPDQRREQRPHLVGAVEVGRVAEEGHQGIDHHQARLLGRKRLGERREIGLDDQAQRLVEGERRVAVAA